jgi:peptide/nickel transport system permease protein
MSIPAAAERPTRATIAAKLRSNFFIRGSLSSWSGRVGIVLFALLVALAVFGPLFAPYSPTAVPTGSTALEGPTQAHVLGTDTLGRDVLSRFLWGGRTLLVVAVVATVLAYLVGIFLGMAAGYRKGPVDLATVAVVDLIISFPPIVLVLLLVAGAGSGLAIVTLAIAAVHVPRVVRIVRAVTLDVSTQEFVEAAISRGERFLSILWRDILPNIWTPVLADFGIRLSGSVILFASLSYLGFGPAPPAADWGLMISENRAAVLVEPIVIVAPAVAIALLTISVNLAADAIARSVGRSLVGRSV